MQRIIQINIASRIIPIEEDAYIRLKDYLTTLEHHFSGEEGNDEIIQDIENRIAELFTTRLQAGAPAILRADVQKVIETLGMANELNDTVHNEANKKNYLPAPYTAPKYSGQDRQYQHNYSSDRLYRNPNDKILGGVCSGLANYFDIDPVIIRMIFVILFLTFGMGLLAYIIAWIVIPAAKTPEQLKYMSNGEPMNFHDIKRNMGIELRNLKEKGEEMSKELKEFFSKKNP